MGNTAVFTIHACVIISTDGFSVGVGVGRVERQEVRIGVSNRVGGSRQVFVHIESTVALIVGSGIVSGVVIIVAVMLVCGIVHHLEQIIARSQIGFAYHIAAWVTCREQQIFKL